MEYKKLEKILLILLLVLAGVVYLYTVAPTLSFWDCGEFISSCFTLAVPHPPGTPFFILIGRVWLMISSMLAAILPISKEVSWHMNLVGISCTLLSSFLAYKIILKIVRLARKEINQTALIIVAFAAALGLAFSYTFWENALETEVYSVATFCFLLLNYLVILWYESVCAGLPKNRYLLLAFYLIFLFTGIQLMPFLIFIPIYVFIFIVERRYLKDWLLILLGFFQAILFAIMFIIPFSTATFILLAAPIVIGLGLILNNPRRFSNWRFFLGGAALVIIAVSTEFYLPLRSRVLSKLYQNPKAQAEYLAGKNTAPRINECEPGENLTAFDNVLHRSQYGPQRLLPRQTQDATGYNVVTGYFWQMAMYVRYLSQQPLPEDVNPLFRGFILLLFYAGGLAGMYQVYRLDRKIFMLLIVIMIMLSFAIVGYLNMKFSPSDTDAKHQPREVRERDYFFHTGFAYFSIFLGFGMYGLIEGIRKWTRQNRFAVTGGLSAVVLFGLVPLATNIRVNNRYKDFIPKDYGYNMLISCADRSLVFTNGDNDTFPLWFAQEVLGFKRDVIVANLSLINTDWYIRQLKYWGAPISFSNYVIKRLQPVAVGNHYVLVKDIMIREIIATNAGIKLKEEDYFSTQESFAAKYLNGYRGRRTIYFSSTVSEDNYKGFAPYLRLEGLVYRLVGDSIMTPRNIDAERTNELFTRVYRYTGVFDPPQQKILADIIPDFAARKKQGEFYDFVLNKDENTKRLYTNYAAGLFALGLYLRDQNDYPGAEKAWRFALAFQPEPDYPFLYNLGILFAQQGRPDSAVAYLTKIKSEDPQLLTQIGSAFGILGANDRAVELLTKAIRINRRFAPAYSALVSVYVNQDDRPSAIRVLGDWLRLNPQDSVAYNMMKELEKP
jgi:hypothetical protein